MTDDQIQAAYRRGHEAGYREGVTDTVHEVENGTDSPGGDAGWAVYQRGFRDGQEWAATNPQAVRP